MMNQARETRPWEGRVVATEGGPVGQALREQVSTKQARKTESVANSPNGAAPLAGRQVPSTKLVGTSAEDYQR